MCEGREFPTSPLGLVFVVACGSWLLWPAPTLPLDGLVSWACPLPCGVWWCGCEEGGARMSTPLLGFVGGGVLLSHTLSSAVPSARCGLSYRVRNGTGRFPTAMTTATSMDHQKPCRLGVGAVNRIVDANNKKESCRFSAISTGQLHPLQGVYFRPIHPIISRRPHPTPQGW